MPENKTRLTCRVCDGAIEPVLSLGEQYVSDFPRPGESDGVRAPLELVLCRRCHLLQLKHTVPAVALDSHVADGDYANMET